jgi:glutathione S-transferase
MTTLPILFIGNKNYSSWSMRPWLALHWAGIAFEAQMVPLGPRGIGINPDIAAVSPSSTLPALKLPSGETIWDTMSICEWANEQAPDADLWPTDPLARAFARSAAAEMHAGFSALRQNMPMNVRRAKVGHVPSDKAQADVARIDALLSGLATRFDASGSGWLFGHRTIADAFYAPVATRFRTYGIALSPLTQKWCDRVFADSAFKDWDRARAETWKIAESDEACRRFATKAD